MLDLKGDPCIASRIYCFEMLGFLILKEYSLLSSDLLTFLLIAPDSSSLDILSFLLNDILDLAWLVTFKVFISILPLASVGTLVKPYYLAMGIDYYRF
jgi:hypothetical protein